MKTKLLFIPLMIPALLMTGCLPSTSFLKENDTPEKFLNSFDENWIFYLSSTEIPETRVRDYDCVVKNAILLVDDFERARGVNPQSFRSFEYYVLESNSTAGPNFKTMTIYDDGSLIIMCKSALGQPSYAYYTFDKVKAAALNDLAEAQILANKDRED